VAWSLELGCKLPKEPRFKVDSCFGSSLASKLVVVLKCYLYVFETIWNAFAFALKLGLHPVTIAHLSPGTSSLLVSKMPTGGSTDTGREYTNDIDFYPIFRRCIMDKRNHFYLVLLQENPFFYSLHQICVHLLVSQIQIGGFTDVGRVFTSFNQIPTGDSHICRKGVHSWCTLLSYVLLMYHGQEVPLLLGIASRKPFLLLSRANLGSFTSTSLPDTNWWLHRCRNGVHACHTLLSYVLYIY
jgi:hypothetical protein